MSARQGVIRAAVATLIGVAGCTGVPGSGNPQTVQHLGAQAVQPVPQPPANADPRTIVLGFLHANVIDAASPGAARVYLTPKTKPLWKDPKFGAPVTVLDNVQVGPYDARHGAVTASGKAIGTLNANGIYRPDLSGVGLGGETLGFPFKVKAVQGQYRIDELNDGLVLGLDDFQRTYQQRTLYFYDAAEHYLVPDARYSAFTDPQALANWLVTQLIAGPRPDLQSAESSSDFPAQDHAQVKLGTVTSIEVPGASGLDEQHLNRLAAQLAETLDQVVPAGQFTITDGGAAVPIPALGEAEFSATQFASSLGPQSGLPAPTIYFLRAGGVVDARGDRLPGALGDGAYHLNSVALSRTSPSAPLYVAGTTGADATQRLLVGAANATLRQTSVTGALTRPSWAAGLGEVWVASATKLYRVTATGGVTQVTAAIPPDGQILALRLSPDASRIALVIKQNGSSQVWVGTIVRAGGQVRVDGLTGGPITPVGVQINDVAWNGALKLFLIGVTLDTHESRIIEVQVDGSGWSARSAPQLPGTPDSITVAENLPAWVSVVGEVWEQSLSSWTSPSDTGQAVNGTNPIYLE